MRSATEMVTLGSDSPTPTIIKSPAAVLTAADETLEAERAPPDTFAGVPKMVIRS
jgi:hypothetical protein